jgi:hypothetical protein
LTEKTERTVIGADFLSIFDKPRRDALVMVFLRMHGQGILANEIFWGLWLFHAPEGHAVGHAFPEDCGAMCELAQTAVTTTVDSIGVGLVY